MQQRAPTRSVPTTTLATVFLIACAAGVAITWSWPTPAPRVAGRGGSGGPAAEPASLAGTAVPAPPAHREPAPEPPSATSAAVHEFAWYVERLRELGERTAELAQQDEIDAARTSDRAARELFAELVAVHPDAAERALAMLTGIPDASADPHDAGRRVVLEVILATECRRRHDAVRRGGDPPDRAGIDGLVQAILDTMPGNSATADVGGAVLGEQPYLRLVHEPGVLALVQLAGDGLFPRAIATRLLLTLWDNLQEHGERSSAETSRLALLLLDDADPSQRIAACRQLLLDPRFRALVLARLHERSAHADAALLADTAANELPPAEALDVLRDLTPLLTHAPGSYIGLGVRAPDVLADAYREHLAADTQPEVRRELVFGVGMVPSPIGLEIAELALANDPSPDVRVQAMFALTAHGGPERAEHAVLRLLDDPAVTGDAHHVAALVAALRNFESGDPNVMDRIGRRLAALPLPDALRQQLEQTLSRSLPGGEVPAAVRRSGRRE